jgi:hypothetical protein
MQLSQVFCKNYRFSKTVLYNKKKNTWVLGNTRFISRVRNLVFPRTMYYSLFILKHNQPMTKPVHIGGVVAQEYIFLEIYTPPPALTT